MKGEIKHEGDKVEFVFHVNVSSSIGQTVFIIGNVPWLGSWDTNKALPLKWSHGDVWACSLLMPRRTSYHPHRKPELPDVVDLHYKYFVASQEGDVAWEESENRHLNLAVYGDTRIFIRDIWNSGSTVFPLVNILRNRPSQPISYPFAFELGAELFVVRGISSSFGHECHSMKIVGNVGELGNWDVNNGVEMIPYVPLGSTDVTWVANVNLSSYNVVQYKYVMVSKNNACRVWESGDNRERIKEFHPNSIFLCMDGYFRKPEKFSQGWAAAGYVGLVNTFAACSMNAVIQTLYHLPNFKKSIYELTLQGGIIGPLSALFHHMDFEPTSANVRPLVERVGLAEDPHEFLILLLYDIKNELQQEDSQSTFVDSQFCGKQKIIRSRTDNPKGSITERDEDFLGVSLQVSGHANLLSSLQYFREPSLLTLAQHSYEQRVEFAQVPPVLIIHLNRTSFDTQSLKEIKICSRYEYPTEFTLAPGKSYQLFSVIAHRGNSSASDGHYYAFIRRDDMWYKFDDENIDVVSSKEAIDDNYGGEDAPAHAYVLVYLLNESKPDEGKTV